MGRPSKLLVLVTVLTVNLGASGVSSNQAIPIFDAHLHYNAEPKPYYPLEQVLALFRRLNVTGVLANSRPNDGTRALVEAKPRDLWVVPFIRPYSVRDDIQTWFDSTKTDELVLNEYKRGYDKGIGEFHLYGDQGLTPVVRRVVETAVRDNLFLHAHTDEAALEILFKHNPNVRVIWAHTGFGTPTKQVETYLKRYPSLICELSYRSGITDAQGNLTPEWRALFTTYPDRFLVGSDTWTDSRWQGYAEIMAEYRAWLGQLPADVAAKIAYQNAQQLFR
jgi:predicted TIM-barrel fold metal-dependent hydrolase